MKQCSFEGCDRPVKSRDLCGGHYKQKLNLQELRPLNQPGRPRVVKRKCKFEGCIRISSCKGYCESHYDQFRRTGKTKPIVTYPKICIVGGCGKKSRCKGLCNAHYRKMLYDQKRVGGRPNWEKQSPICSFRGCTRPTRAKNLCDTHYNQLRNTGKMKPIRPPYEPKPCSYEGCDKPHAAKGLCNAHFKQMRAGKELTDLTDPPRKIPAADKVQAMQAIADGMSIRQAAKKFGIHYGTLIKISRSVSPEKINSELSIAVEETSKSIESKNREIETLRNRNAVLEDQNASLREKLEDARSKARPEIDYVPAKTHNTVAPGGPTSGWMRDILGQRDLYKEGNDRLVKILERFGIDPQTGERNQQELFEDES